MFTGIIEARGTIQALRRRSVDVQLKVATHTLDMSDVHIGDSIAVNGVCLTVVEYSQDHFCADVSHETLSRSSLGKLKVGSNVNLEKAMAANGRFGGHMVSGHVDGLATVKSVSHQGLGIDIWLEFPAELGKYIAEKGSITLDGISLTVNELRQSQFRLTIIPHSAEQTTISEWRKGSQINLEVDVVARYLERLLQSPNSTHTRSDTLSEEKLAECGFLSLSRGL
ncbi:riboflavin synthase [Celerinatantimonas diazotrophica]|uniref:Riboflavin synthase n=1 Tax=Celerinatantimonas diazotrophica TaxID=412034 RepID=A0A4R1K3M2_9GAMM|nr:riboflavin synthase [Celerinatantimonas diazotrophica]TCK58695.1 riboflavin synthase alpha chain [Celerinatantimonas diazotrophica]CAG9297324.1 Riboflavin synthase [Celerinatantimonas diazotrophica]